MGRPRKPSDYKVALEALRKKHADKIEHIFLDMYHIARGQDENGNPISVEDRDRVNAGKIVVSLLGVPRVGSEKPVEAPKDIKGQEKPTLSKEHSKVLDDILGSL